MKCDQDLCLNLWYDLKKLLWQDELNGNGNVCLSLGPYGDLLSPGHGQHLLPMLGSNLSKGKSNSGSGDPQPPEAEVRPRPTWQSLPGWTPFRSNASLPCCPGSGPFSWWQFDFYVLILPDGLVISARAWTGQEGGLSSKLVLKLLKKCFKVEKDVVVCFSDKFDVIAV